MSRALRQCDDAHIVSRPANRASLVSHYCCWRSLPFRRASPVRQRRIISRISSALSGLMGVLRKIISSSAVIASGVEVSRGSASKRLPAAARSSALTAFERRPNVARSTSVPARFFNTNPIRNQLNSRSIDIIPVMPSACIRAVTAGAPPARRRHTSVALLSLINIINSSRLRTERATPGLLKRSERSRCQDGYQLA